MKRCLIILSLLCSIFCSAQSRRKLDSLLRVKPTEDTIGIKLFSKISRAYSKFNYHDSGLYYTKLAIDLSRRLKNDRFLAATLLDKCYRLKPVLLPKAYIDTLLILYNDPLIRGKKATYISVCQDLGVTYRNIANYEKSIAYLLEATKIGKELNDSISLVNSYNSLANTYSQSGLSKKSSADIKRALENYENSYRMVKKDQGDVLNMLINNKGVSYYNIGQISHDSTATLKAIELFRTSLEYRIMKKDSAGIADSYGNLAGGYHDLCSYHQHYTYLDESKRNFEKAIEISQAIKSPTLYRAYSSYGSLLGIIGLIRKNKSYLKTALQYMYKSSAKGQEKDDLFNTMTDYHNMADVYDELGQKDSALKYLRKHLALKDTMLSEENKQVAAELTAKYESDLKDAENNNLKDQAALREEVIAKKSNTIKLMIGATTIMTALIIMVFISLQKIRRSKQLIEEQKKQTEQQKLIIEHKNKEIIDSINYAKTLQDAAIPSMNYFRSILPQSFIYYQPKDIVAGDFYWIYKLKNKILVAAADCTGHGVPGAMVSIVCLNAINRCVDEFKLTEPSKILDKTSEIIQQSFRQSENNVQDGMDIALVLLDPDNGTGYFSGANNPLWILKNEDVTEITGDSQPVGKQHKPNPFSQYEFKLEKDSTLFLFTDGFADQFGGPNGKKLKARSFKSQLASLHNTPITEMAAPLEAFFNKWKGDLEQVDDILVIGIRI